MGAALTSVRSVPRWYRVAVVTVAALLYVWACFLPASTIGADPDRPTFSLEHLVIGWMSGLQGIPAWGSNFVFLYAGICLLRSLRAAAAVMGITAVILGLTTLTSFKSNIVYVGYYVWLASQIVLALGSIIGYLWPDVRKDLSRESTSQ